MASKGDLELADGVWFVIQLSGVNEMLAIQRERVEADAWTPDGTLPEYMKVRYSSVIGIATTKARVAGAPDSQRVVTGPWPLYTFGMLDFGEWGTLHARSIVVMYRANADLVRTLNETWSGLARESSGLKIVEGGRLT